MGAEHTLRRCSVARAFPHAYRACLCGDGCEACLWTGLVPAVGEPCPDCDPAYDKWMAQERAALAAEHISDESGER